MGSALDNGLKSPERRQFQAAWKGRSRLADAVHAGSAWPGELWACFTSDAVLVHGDCSPNNVLRSAAKQITANRVGPSPVDVPTGVHGDPHGHRVLVERL